MRQVSVGGATRCAKSAMMANMPEERESDYVQSLAAARRLRFTDIGLTDASVTSLDDLRARIDETRAQGYAPADRALESDLSRRQ
jgi:DNA-binding IclR family transcriptional regulator